MINNYKRIIIKQAFDRNETFVKKIGSDSLGEWFGFIYPGADINKYYHDIGIVIDRWNKIFDEELLFASLKYYKNDEYKYIIRTNGYFYLLKNKVNIDGKYFKFNLNSRFPYKTLIVSIDQENTSDKLIKSIKNEKSLNKFLENVEKIIV